MIVTRAYITDIPELKTDFKVFSCDKNIFIDNTTNDSNGDLYVYDVAGHLIKKGTFNSKSITTVPLNVSAGAYIVKAISNGEESTKSIIIR